MIVEILVSSARSLYAWSPIVILLPFYVVSMIFIFTSKTAGNRNMALAVNIFSVWKITSILLYQGDFNRFPGFIQRDGLLFFTSTFLVMVMGGLYFGLQRELNRPEKSFQVSHAIASIIGIGAVFTILLLVDIGPAPNPYYPFWEPSAFVV